MRKILGLLLVVCLLGPMGSLAQAGILNLRTNAEGWGVLMGLGVARHKGGTGPVIAAGAFRPGDSKYVLPGYWFNLWGVSNASGGAHAGIFLGKGIFMKMASYSSYSTYKAEQGVVLGLNAYGGLRYLNAENEASFLAPAIHLGLGSAGHYSGHDLFGEIYCETASRGAPVWGGILRISF